jgi:uncharacterized DUF497 family protein
MRITRDKSKEKDNISKHGLDFSFAPYIAADPLGVLVYDRYENGEHRYHAIGVVGGKCLVLVHTYPDPDDDDWIRVIGLREATAHERKRYEEDDD